MRDFRWGLEPQQPLSADEHIGMEKETLDWGEAEWGTHRFHIRQLLDESIGLLGRREKAAVLGAGNHGDVDLPGLSAHFQGLTVLDTEDNVLEEILESTGSPAAGRIKSLTRVDYTGLDQISFYERYEELLTGEASADQLIAFLRDSAFQARRVEVLPHLRKSFSLVVSSGVHTQLFYGEALAQFHGHMDRYAEGERKSIIEAIRSLRNSLVTAYNQTLLSLLKPEGRIVMWSEMIHIDESKADIMEELNGKTLETDRTAYLFSVFGKYGIDAAVLGLKDLHDKVKTDQLLFRSWSWHTESGKRYLVAGMSGVLR
ncbi:MULTISPECIES: hypothetical protein [Paenibacillus]|uniref:hypothetical protein n=1 Tax=Paenibacillus TaxID=44249 RepID=UPI0022B858B3|nr:hypothetical protein [Paenibacillus caseinilyticus]MCZ8518908.1 hypothetical protein [Paenibacillus caseinilyticus]